MGSSVVLLGDQLPVPSQQGLRCDHAGDLGKSLSSQRFGLNGQPPALLVIEAHSLATELFSQHPILFSEIFNDLQFQNPLSRPPNRSSETSHLHADPVFGPYAITVAGLTMTRTDRQSFHTADSHTQRTRSGGVNFGRFTERCRTPS